MADLTVEQFEQVPDFLKTDYVQEGDVYRHTGELKAAKLKASLDNLDGKYKETNSKLTAYEQKQVELQAEAERKALEKLKAEGKVDEILADADRRIGESAKAYEERIGQMTEVAKRGRREEIVSDLSGFAIDNFKSAFKKLAASMVDYDPLTGKEIYFNEDGSASSATNRAEFMREVLEKSPTFQFMLKGSSPTTGAGLVNGNTAGRASVTDNNSAAEAAKKKGDVRGFLNAKLKPN